jgi:sirohydrochlorin cobaltochelatase
MRSGRGVLLVGHGSHLNPDSSAPTIAHAERLRESGRYDEVRVGFWKEEPSMSRALDAFDADDVTVVPVFMSNGYFVQQVIPREMRLQGKVSCVDGKTVRYTAAIGDHPSLAKVVIERAGEVGATGGDALAVLGHGTPRNPESERNIYRQSEYVRELGAYGEVTTVFIDQEPFMQKVFEMVEARRVVMVPLFIADGWHVGETIPEDMSLDANAEREDGRALLYAGAVGTHPSVADVITELVEEAAAW